jgi:hypothetical protein
MAGSYRKIVDGHNNFIGTAKLTDMNDASDALEECHAMIAWLCKGDKRRIHDAWLEGYVKTHTAPPQWDRVSGERDFWNKDDLTP